MRFWKKTLSLMMALALVLELLPVRAAAFDWWDWDGYDLVVTVNDEPYNLSEKPTALLSKGIAYVPALGQLVLSGATLDRIDGMELDTILLEGSNTVRHNINAGDLLIRGDGTLKVGTKGVAFDGLITDELTIQGASVAATGLGTDEELSDYPVPVVQCTALYLEQGASLTVRSTVQIEGAGTALYCGSDDDYLAGSVEVRDSTLAVSSGSAMEASGLLAINSTVNTDDLQCAVVQLQESQMTAAWILAEQFIMEDSTLQADGVECLATSASSVPKIRIVGSTVTDTSLFCGVRMDYESDGEWDGTLDRISDCGIEIEASTVTAWEIHTSVYAHDAASAALGAPRIKLTDCKITNGVQVPDLYEEIGYYIRYIMVEVDGEPVEGEPIKISSRDSGVADVLRPAVTWSVEDGVLTISGFGEMPDYAAGDQRPWDEYADSIQKIVVEDGITSIGDRAFLHLSSAASVALPEGLEEIGVNAFYGCSKLKKVTLPETLELLDAGAFQFCKALKEIWIPEATAVNYVETVFTGCVKLEAVRVKSNNPNLSSYYGVVYNKDKSILLYCPEGRNGTYTVHFNTQAVAGGAFCSCDLLTRINFPVGLTRLAVESYYDGSMPAGLESLHFSGAAPEVPDHDTEVLLEQDIMVFYYEDQEGWEELQEQTWAQQFSFQSVSSVVDVKPYVSKTAKGDTYPTVEGMQYFTNNKKSNTAGEAVNSLDSVQFVNGVTAVSLLGADEDTADFIREQLTELLYVSKYRPQQFGSSETSLEDWPIQNNAEKSGKVVKNDSGLAALGVKQVKWTNGAWGCYAYARFACAYVYGDNGSPPKTLKSPDTEELVELFHAKLDPGETIRYFVKGNVPHALVFLGESMDGAGFYFISYGGGKYGKTESHTMNVGYISYSKFASICKKVFVEDANGGSYYEHTAHTVSEDPKTLCGKVDKKVSYAVLQADCPIELEVLLDGTALFDSRDMENGETAESEYGTLLVESDGGEGRSITLTLFDPQLLDFDIRFYGTGEGTMDLTGTYFIEDDSGELWAESRGFYGVPLTDVTELEVSAPSAQADLQMQVYEGSEVAGVWSAGSGESVLEPKEELALSCNHGDLGESEIMEGVEITGLSDQEDGVLLSVTVSNTSEELQEMILIAAAYEDQRMVSVARSEVKLVSAEGTIETDMLLQGITLSDDLELKVFALAANNSYIPLDTPTEYGTA